MNISHHYLPANFGTAARKQSGATLITALIMLVVLTLLVVSGIRSSTTNLRIAGNMQFQEEAAAAVQQAIEAAISSTVFMDGQLPPQTIGNLTITFDPPSCRSAKAVAKSDPGVPDECYGSAGKTYCYWTTWDIGGVAVDAQTGARTEIHQGVRVPAGQKTAYAYCGV